jgi:DNA-binding transcriptional ArsR family regulator
VTPAPLDQIFIALADPARRAMVERLCEHPLSVKDLAQPIGMGLPSALKHLRVLEEGGIVLSSKQGRVRTYAISPTAFAAINDWLAHRTAAMTAAFDRLDQALADFPEQDDHDPA